MLTCTAKLVNNGNVRLENITFSGHANCTEPEVVLPQHHVPCSFSMISTQDEFENGIISWSVAVTATPLGTNSTQLTATSLGNTTLQQTPQLVLDLVRIAGIGNTTASTAVVSEANTSVVLLVTANNTGNIHLHNVVLEVPGLTSPLSCASTGLTKLEVDQHIQCSGSFMFDQDAFEGGSRTFIASGNATNTSNTTFSQAVAVNVAASPQLQVDVDGLDCTVPLRMRKCGCPQPSRHGMACLA